MSYIIRTSDSHLGSGSIAYTPLDASQIALERAARLHARQTIETPLHRALEWARWKAEIGIRPVKDLDAAIGKLDGHSVVFELCGSVIARIRLPDSLLPVRT